MTSKISILPDRSIIEISGDDRKNFLQGLITNDIHKLHSENLLFSAMLNPKGRFLYDFFIFENDEKLYLDCFKDRRDEIARKLNFYKLRSKVTVKKNDDITIASNIEKDLEQNINGKIFADPRSEKMGNRIYFFDDNFKQNEILEPIYYHQARLKNKIAESEHDLTFEKSLILEFGFNEQNAVNYDKGCYIGQELTARTHHMGQIRKKIYQIRIENSEEKIEKNDEITCEGKKIGIVLSSYFFAPNLHALALIKYENEENLAKNLEINSKKITIIN